MGFLNHSTNNIIIDAVLTEYGREKLSLSNGEFNVSHFAFGDDEVDYSLITKYGLIVGQEKIEKNTPIMEAHTNQNLAQKYRLISLPNVATRVLYIPVLSKVTPIVSSVSLQSKTISNKTSSIEVLSTIENSAITTPPDKSLVDNEFIVTVSDFLLKISGVESRSIDSNRIATYVISGVNPTNNNAYSGARSAIFTISVSETITDSIFSIYGNADNKTIITTQIEVVGRNSGSRIVIPVTISNS